MEWKIQKKHLICEVNENKNGSFHPCTRNLIRCIIFGDFSEFLDRAKAILKKSSNTKLMGSVQTKNCQ